MTAAEQEDGLPPSPTPVGSEGPGRSLFVYWMALVVVMGAVAVLLFAFDPNRYGFYPRCMFHQVTGLDCPGCGGLRATHQLLHGHFREALALNPLIMVLLPVVCWGLLSLVWRRATGRDLNHPFRHRAWLWALMALIVVFGVVRNLPIPGFKNLSTQGKAKHVQNHWR